MMKWYENHRHNWSYCHDLRFWISFYIFCGWEAVEYDEIPPFCVYAICHMPLKMAKIVTWLLAMHTGLKIWGDDRITVGGSDQVKLATL